MKTIILISGWKRSGKDTVAYFVGQRTGALQLSLAGPLKDQVAARYGFPRSWCDEQSKKELPLIGYPVDEASPAFEFFNSLLKDHWKAQDGKLFWTPRALLILEGTGVARFVHSDIWVQNLARSINESKGEKFVISDCRFPNEIDGLKAIVDPGSLIVSLRINRFDSTDATDVTESALDKYDFDYEIQNRGTLAELYSKVEAVLSLKKII